MRVSYEDIQKEYMQLYGYGDFQKAANDFGLKGLLRL